MVIGFAIGMVAAFGFMAAWSFACAYYREIGRERSD